jgi:hypothetical protein
MLLDQMTKKFLPDIPGIYETENNQILHTISSNKPYWENNESYLFVEKHLKESVPLMSYAEILKFASDRVTLQGLFIELGVYTGRTINFIAALNPRQTVYGFDSFEGLPEPWIREDLLIPSGAGRFNQPGELPIVLNNVQLIKGWFSHTLPPFTLQGPIAFLHVDCDLYSSTATAFKHLGNRIQPGSILVFDEFYNYPSSEEHEFKAFQEFLREKKYKANYLAYNIYHEQVVVQIVENTE